LSEHSVISYFQNPQVSFHSTFTITKPVQPQTSAFLYPLISGERYPVSWNRWGSSSEQNDGFGTSSI